MAPVEPRFPPLREAAIWITAASAAVYLVGSLYLDSYYARLGLPDTELHFEVPFVMVSSLLPLMLPAFWLAMVAAACQLLNRRMVKPEWASPFFPIPAPVAVAFTLAFCAIGSLIAATLGVRAPIFMGWTFRGVILVGVALAWFAVTFANARRAHAAGPPERVTRSTQTLIGMLAVALVLGLLSMVTGDRAWPFGPWQSTFLTLAFGAAVIFARREVSAAKVAVANTGEWITPSLEGRISNPPATIFFTVVAVVSLLLHAGMTGMAQAEKVLEGCTSSRTVKFEPVPEGLHNGTYLLVLHQHERYYIMELNGTGGTKIVPDQLGVATVSAQSSSTECETGL